MPDLTTSDGVRLHVEDDGEGTPIVLVHGWCGSSRVWEPVVDGLLDGRRVVRPDLRACGSSQSRENTLGFEHNAADLRFLITELGLDRPTLVGWSFGVGVVHTYLQTYGEDDLNGVCLVDYPVKLVEKRDMADKVCHQLAKRRDEFLQRFTTRMFLEQNPEMEALVIQEMRRTAREAACRMYRAMGTAPNPVEETFETPALLIFPEKGWFPEALKDWRVRFPEHEAPPFERSAHAPPLEETQRFVEALRDFSEAKEGFKTSTV
jgi:pimeloyl-ACP methyl ester carboxylesterase